MSRIGKKQVEKSKKQVENWKQRNRALETNRSRIGNKYVENWKKCLRIQRVREFEIIISENYLTLLSNFSFARPSFKWL